MTLFRASLAMYIALSICAIGSISTDAAARVSTETFAADPTMGRPSISPNGKYVAVPVRRTEEQLILIVDLDAPADSKPVGIPMGNDIEVEWVSWKNDDGSRRQELGGPLQQRISL